MQDHNKIDSATELSKMSFNVASLYKLFFVCLFVHCLIFYTAITTASANCTTGSVRLAGGPKPNAGRVEVCINKAWGTMCAVNSQWDEANANVVCSQLGFQRYGEFLICAQVK